MKYLIVLLCFFIYGCGSTGEKPIKTIATQIDVPIAKVDDIAERVKTNTEKIETLSTAIVQKTKEPETKEKAQEIKFVNNENKTNVKKLENTEKELGEVKKSNENIVKELENIKRDMDSGYRKIWLGVFGLNVIILCFGIYLSFVYSQKFGLPIVFSSLSVISICYFFSTYFLIASIFGGILALGGLTCVVVNAIKERKALKETVVSFEAQKNLTWSDEAKKIVNSIQSIDTKQLITNIKEELK